MALFHRTNHLKWLFPILVFAASTAYGRECYELLLQPVMEQTFAMTPTGDFEIRDSLPQTDVPPELWQDARFGEFGPCSLPYPEVVFPSGVDRVAWSRERVIAAAKKWIGVSYKHYHFPNMGGMDCSNFTAFVYNYAFGMRFTSNVDKQAVTVGRRLKSDEKLQPGDLLFRYSEDGTRVSHVEIFIDEDTLIDSTGPGVAIRPFAGIYKTRFAWATRILE